VHAVKAKRGNGSMAPLILDLGSRRRWVVNFTPQEMNPQCTMNRKLGWIHSQSGHFAEEKNLLLLPGIEPQIILPIA
jgi:hypothetical protein